MVLGIVLVGIIAIILVLCSKVLNVLIGSICVIGGLIFNSYLESSDSLEFRLEMAFKEGITTSDMSSFSNMVIVVGVVLLIIGIVRLVTSKKKQNNINNYYVQNTVPASSIFCAKCGSRNNDDATFCNACGEKLEKEELKSDDVKLDDEVARLKKIKELFDNGNITQEEYDEKRKSILEKI